MKKFKTFSTLRGPRIFLTASTALLIALFPQFVHSQYHTHVAIMTLLYAVLSMSLNLVTGLAGQISVGHAAFYGLGAYTCSLLMLSAHVSFVPALLLGGVVAAAFGFLLGLPALRLKGNYLCIVTLGFGELVRLVLLNYESLTRGSMGISNIPLPEIWGMTLTTKPHFYYLMAVLFFSSFLILDGISRSRTGLLLATVRDDDIAASSIGVDIVFLKLSAFVVSAFFAGICGGFFAAYLSYISPDSFTFKESITILSMVILGGRGNMVGAVMGAVLLTVLPESLRFVRDYRMILYGMILVLAITFKPDGLYGLRYRPRLSIAKRGDRK